MLHLPDCMWLVSLTKQTSHLISELGVVTQDCWKYSHALMNLSCHFNVVFPESICRNTILTSVITLSWLLGSNLDLCLWLFSVWRFPLYYEVKVAFVIWLLSPYTRGASLIYRKILHPLLISRERVILLLLHCNSNIRCMKYGLSVR